MKKNVVVGICGGISAYKTCELVRLLIKDKFKAKVVMTEASTKFVTALTFETLSQNPVYTEMFRLKDAEGVEHISLADWADLLVIAPLTANTLSKVAFGICDNLLTTVTCALPKDVKVLMAPAMNENMWKNPIIQGNFKKLISLKKYCILNPGRGELACGAVGQGRMAEPSEIFAQIKKLIK